jgi:hypothetical protein
MYSRGLALVRGREIERLERARAIKPVLRRNRFARLAPHSVGKDVGHASLVDVVEQDLEGESA